MNAHARFTGCTLLELQPSSCRWPISETGRKGHYLFCGCPKAHPGVPYCTEHMRAAVNPKLIASPQACPSLNGYTAKPYSGDVSVIGESYAHARLRGTLTARLHELAAVKLVGRRDVTTMSTDDLREEARAIAEHRDDLEFDSEWIAFRLHAISEALRRLE